MLSEFHFLRPYWFISLVPLSFILWFLTKRHLRNQHWERICSPALLPYILVGKTDPRRYWDISLLGIISLLSVVALAGPTWQRVTQPLFQKQSALVIALDLSYSMYADDIKPNRFERAQFKISDLLNLRKEGQTALLVYAGDAFTVAPLTDDTETIKSQLPALSPDIMPAPGNNTQLALKKAVALLRQSGSRQGYILLITDEVELHHQDDFEKVNAAGYPVSILAMGTNEGAPAKLSDGGFLKDHTGTIVVPKLKQNNLRKLAKIGGGRYALNQINDNDIDRLHQFFMRGLGKEKEAGSEFKIDQWREFGPWLILLIIPIAVGGFRRGYLSIFLGMILINPEQAIALEWDDLWLNKSQKAMHALNNKQPDAAAELFQNGAWKAVAKYRSGDYSAAVKLLEQQDDVTNIYNKANALAKQGHYQEAIATYKVVLEKDPEHEDTKYNKALVEEALARQQNQQSSQSDQNSPENKSKNKKDQKDQAPSENTHQDQQQAEPEQSHQQQQEGEQDQEPSSKQKAVSQNQPVDRNDETDKQTQQLKVSLDNAEGTEPKEVPSQQKIEPLDEAQQASEQWLRRIPDDPAALLRRKFKYQYQQRRQQPKNEKYW